MHPRARWRLQRWLAALLCLLASFAYLERDQGGALSGGMVMGRTVAEHAATVPAAVQAAPAPDMADMPGMAMPQDQAPLTAPDLYHGGPNAPPHDHAAHCPFCFTAAFALTAQDFLVPNPGATRLPHPAAPAPGLPHRAAIHADARAPPV